MAQILNFLDTISTHEIQLLRRVRDPYLHVAVGEASMSPAPLKLTNFMRKLGSGTHDDTMQYTIR